MLIFQTCTRLSHANKMPLKKYVFCYKNNKHEMKNNMKKHFRQRKNYQWPKNITVSSWEYKELNVTSGVKKM